MKNIKLEQIRKNIDVVDAKIISLIARRASYMPAVAKYKKENNLPIFQPERKEEIIKSRAGLAKKSRINPSLIKKIFLLILKNSREIQKKELPPKGY